MLSRAYNCPACPLHLCVVSSEGIFYRMLPGSILPCDEYGIDGLSLTWALEVLFVPVCEITGSGSVEGT